MQIKIDVFTFFCTIPVFIEMRAPGSVNIAIFFPLSFVFYQQHFGCNMKCDLKFHFFFSVTLSSDITTVTKGSMFDQMAECLINVD